MPSPNESQRETSKEPQKEVREQDPAFKNEDLPKQSEPLMEIKEEEEGESDREGKDHCKKCCPVCRSEEQK
ncbi:hypothetical protein ACHAPU_008239 [Fusarium lateritium]